MTRKKFGSYISSLKTEGAGLFKKGLFHIFGGSLLVKIIGFADVTLLIRILSKTEYGQWGYARNIFQIVLLFAAFGAPAGILQFCARAKTHSEKVAFWKFGFLWGLMANLLLALVMVLLSLFVPFPILGSNPILLGLSLLPTLMILFDSQTIFLRATFRNKEFAGASLFNSALFLGFTVSGALTFGVPGVIAGRYIAMLFSVGLGFKMLKKEWKEFWGSRKLGSSQRKAFLSFSVVAMLSTSISSLLYKIDTFLVGTLSESAEIVASYQTATLIPFNLNFIPLALMTFAYPYFAQKSHNQNWIRKNLKKLITRLGVLNGAISGLLFIFAPHIINILFGSQYADSVIPFRILAVGYFFAGTFRIPLGNVIAAMGKIKVNFWFSLGTGIMNIFLDYWFIQKWGAIGAAWATLIVFLISSWAGIGFFLFWFHRKSGSPPN